MANPQRNQLLQQLQWRTLMGVGLFIMVVIALIIILLSDSHPKPKPSVNKELDITGIVDESFSKADGESALTAQQAEVDALKSEMNHLTKTLATLHDDITQQLQAQTSFVEKQLERVTQKKGPVISSNQSPEFKENMNNPLPFNPTETNNALFSPAHPPVLAIHTVSFKPKQRIQPKSYLNPAHYVPSNTSVKAVVLGGADADASVNGQSKNNGVMLFKFLDDGTLPNGKRSRLRGCRVSANSYGDISSERAFATLYRLSCAHKNEPIIDKEVTGWVFFNGKVGIKGVPLMRDNKVMQWAGISGALSGIAQAAQYAQSVQQFGAYGASSFVPSGNIVPYAGYGGATKAADTLSQYYVKRAEQYHPVIQIGAGNVVTVVFKDGFYLEPEDDKHHASPNHSALSHSQTEQVLAESPDNTLNFTVPPEVLGQLNRENPDTLAHSGVIP